MSDVILNSLLTCPNCGFTKKETMSTDSCVFFYKCRKCGEVFRPKPGDYCVFCTVPDPLQGLREMYSVLRPGGSTMFLEHMRSRRFVLNIPLSVMNVFTVPLVGTSMLRETQKNIEHAGFSPYSSLCTRAHAPSFTIS